MKLYHIKFGDGRELFHHGKDLNDILMFLSRHPVFWQEPATSIMPA